MAEVLTKLCSTPAGTTTAEPSRKEAVLAVKNDLALPGLDADELVAVTMALEADLFAGAQRHHHELLVRPCEEHLTEVLVFQSLLFDISHVTRYTGLSSFDCRLVAHVLPAARSYPRRAGRPPATFEQTDGSRGKVRALRELQLPPSLPDRAAQGHPV